MSWRRITARLILSLLALVASGIVSQGAAEAALLPSAPIPRVDPGKHVGFITKIDVTTSGRFAITVSDDKTARIWDLERQRLHKTLRVPIAGGHEGRLTVGAISEEAGYAAVAGFTGMLSGEGGTVYVFDLDSDAMYLIRGYAPAAVDNLLFSRDGRYLAVAMANSGGLLLFDVSSGSFITRQMVTDERMYGIAFGPDNSVIVSSLDGKLHRFAAPAFELIDSKNIGDEPMHLRYSPDDRQIALGYRSSPKVTILDAVTLDTVRTLDASSVDGLFGLIAAEWNLDGRYIYAGGRTVGNVETPLLRWDLTRNDPPETLLMAPKRIGDIHRLPSGGILYASGMPTIGLVDEQGHETWQVDAATADIRAENNAALPLTSDGLGVRFPYDRQGQRQGYFNALTINPNVRLADATIPATNFTGPRADSGDWRVSYDREVSSVQVNGESVPLERLESPRAHTVSRRGETLFVGTTWYLRGFDKDRNELWRTELTGAAQLLNTSADDRWLVASLSDGTIRWFRTTDGELVLSLFPHANGDDWIAWIPQGYYMSSLYGDELMGWQINKGWTTAPEFYRAVSFERVLYRPDVVQAYIQSYGDSASITALLGPDSFTVADLAAIAPPKVVANTVADPNTGATRLEVSAESGPLAMQEISVYVNGIPINAAKDRRIRIAESDEFSRAYDLPLELGENHVRVEVANGASIGVEEQWVDGAVNVDKQPGDLFVLAIGVSEFLDKDVPDLRYAAKDAIDIASQFRDTKTATFDNVYTQVVADEQALRPDRETIRKTLSFLERADANDTVILFFASHGLTVGRDYYFAPTDARIDTAIGEDVTEDDLELATFLSWKDLFEPMRLAAGKRLMIVDTCASGDVSGPADLFTLQKRSASSKIAFMTASAGNQLSQELSRKQQGLFTFSVLMALRDAYDPNGDGQISLNEVYDLSMKMVPAWRENKAEPQNPQLMAPDFLASMTLAATGG